MLRKIVFILLSVILVGTGYLFAYREIRGLGKSAMILLEIFPLAPIKPLTLTTKQPRIIQVDIPSGDRKIDTDIWFPGNYREGKKYPVVILSAGVNLAKDDTRITGIVEGLARSGFVVSVSNMPELLNARYLNQSVEDFVSVFKYLENQPYAKKDKIGFAGFCLGSSIALLASERQEINQRVSFLSINDVLYDMYSFTRDATTEKINDSDRIIDWVPLDEVRKILFTEYTDYISDENEALIIYQSLFEKKPLDKKTYDNLSDESKVFYDFLSNNDPDKSQDLFDKLPGKAKTIIASMSPKANIKNIRAKVFITSGRNVFLPASQAIDLSNDLPQDQVVYMSLNFFQHDKIVRSLSNSENIQQAVLAAFHLKHFFDFTN